MVRLRVPTLAVLVSMGAACLLFPDIVPHAVRTPVVTGMAGAAMLTGLRFMSGFPFIQAVGSMFVLTLLIGWLRLPVHDLVGLRHLSGVALGLLAAGGFSRVCQTERALAWTAGVIGMLAGGTVAVGLASTTLDTAKFIDTWRFRPTPLYPWLPDWTLRLPGLSGAGKVNPNALAGTAVLIAPLCAGAAAAAMAFRGRGRWVLITSGLLTTSIAIAVIGMALSRTAWLAALLTLGAFGLRWRRGRWWVASALMVVAVIFSFGRPLWAPAAGSQFDEALGHTFRNFEERRLIWAEAADQLRFSPWLGLGINQFHDVTQSTGNGGTGRVAHAHNMFLQVALDAGLLGLAAYVSLMCGLVWLASGTASRGGVPGRVAAGGGMALVGVHLFGLGDAIALGAKVGLFQWLATGLILAATSIQRQQMISGISEPAAAPPPAPEPPSAE